MPRGVYDRTKTPEQRAAEKSLGGGKTKAAKAPKAAKTAAPKKGPKAAKAAAKPEPKKYSSPDVAKAKISTASRFGELDTSTKFSIVRDNIATLVGAVQGLTGGSANFSSSPGHSIDEIVTQLDDELKANIGVLSGLRRDVFGLSETEQAAEAAQAAQTAAAEATTSDDETSEDEDEEEEAAPVAAAPVAPPAPAQPYPQGSVPMPPAPVGFPQT